MQRRFTVESEIWLCDEIRFNSARNLELYFFKRLGATFQHFHPLTSLWEHTPRTSQERRRVERFRLSTTGRMPWRTVKLGSFVLIGAWTISLATWLNAVAAAFFTHIFWSMSIDVNEIFICVAWKGYGLVAHFHTDVFEEREVDFGYLVSFINRLGGWKESVLNIFSLVDVVFEWHIYIYGMCRLRSTILVEVWIVAFVSFEALHHNNTSTLDDALAAGDTKAPEVDSLLWHLGHNQHKARLRTPLGNAWN